MDTDSENEDTNDTGMFQTQSSQPIKFMEGLPKIPELLTDLLLLNNYESFYDKALSRR